MSWPTDISAQLQREFPWPAWGSHDWDAVRTHTPAVLEYPYEDSRFGGLSDSGAWLCLHQDPAWRDALKQRGIRPRVAYTGPEERGGWAMVHLLHLRVRNYTETVVIKGIPPRIAPMTDVELHHVRLNEVLANVEFGTLGPFPKQEASRIRTWTIDCDRVKHDGRKIAPTVLSVLAQHVRLHGLHAKSRALEDLLRQPGGAALLGVRSAAAAAP